MRLTADAHSTSAIAEAAVNRKAADASFKGLKSRPHFGRAHACKMRSPSEIPAEKLLEALKPVSRIPCLNAEQNLG
jgi:hypothetical protein